MKPKIYNSPPAEVQTLLTQVEKIRSTISAAQQAQRLAWIHAMIKAWGAQCLSTHDYKTHETKFAVRCAHGHEFSISYAGLAGQHWCKQCYFDAMRFTLADMQVLARSKGGECLSTEYVDINTPMHWRCKNGHEWHVKGAIVVKSWCARCHFDAKRTKIEDIKAWARGRGYTCLSDTYTGHQEVLHWRCDRGHEWHARWRGTHRMNLVSECCPICREILRTENKEREQRRKQDAKIQIGRKL